LVFSDSFLPPTPARRRQQWENLAKPFEDRKGSELPWLFSCIYNRWGHQTDFVYESFLDGSMDRDLVAFT